MQVFPQRRWRLRPGYIDETTAEQLGAAHGVSGLIAQVAAARLGRAGIDVTDTLTDDDPLETYLLPGLRHLPDPQTIPGLADACEAIVDALLAGETVAVWGDYDVDGVTAAALLSDFFRLRLPGLAPVQVHLPNRTEEGYGLNTDGLDRLQAAGAGVVVTVDCGITDVAAIEHAEGNGLAVIVTDHHLPGKELPPATAICNPRLTPTLEPCPCAEIAGVGVAFFLAAALNRALPAELDEQYGGTPIDIRPLLDLVALGTLADVVRLQGVNRVLVKNGMLLLTEARRPGIHALKKAAGLDPFGALSAGQVVFTLAPRINAAGRMGGPQDALTMLLAPDRETARPYAEKLDAVNRERRAEEERITEEALAQAEEQATSHVGLTICGEDWHPGVIGIVASRVAERFNRPTLILTKSEDDSGGMTWKGSGRSIPEADLHGALCECGHLLSRFGGHKQAAGLEVADERLGELRAAFNAAITAQCGPAPLPATLSADAELSFGQITYELLKELELLQPFGMGNAEPLFISRPVVVASHRVFGRGHVRAELREPESGIVLHAKFWRQAEHFTRELRGATIRVAFSPKRDDYGGSLTIDLHVKDWLTGERARTPLPVREMRCIAAE